MNNTVDVRRIRQLNDNPPGGGTVIYWMSRDQRSGDNWALLYAQELALAGEQPLAVVFCLVPSFLEATWRQYSFMLQGLRELEESLRALNIGFYLLAGEPGEQLVRFCKRQAAGALVCDFSPLRINRRWKQEVAGKVRVACHEVDAHNIVPCWHVSQKQEYAAYTLRPRIHRVLPEFLTDIPRVRRHPYGSVREVARVDWGAAEKALNVDRAVPEVRWLLPGEAAGRKAMAAFIAEKLVYYGERRNDPALDGQSNLSPYLHFGQIGAQRLALAVSRAGETEEAGREEESSSIDNYLEELVVRRELADNFCFYNNAHYDSTEGFPRWARETLALHEADRREYIYSRDDFEEAQTHDPLWNAAQMEMVRRGKMHGYMRMYWAKKILEWTESPREAMATAIYLNDRYSLDGRDPNGYAGIAWSIGGVHDRAWGERPVFGKVRYMSYKGSRSKFDVAAYIAKVDGYGEE